MIPESIRRYVSRIEEACGEEADYIVLLKHDLREEAIKKILTRGVVIRSVSGVLTYIRYKNKLIGVFSTGKLVMKEIKDKKELKEILNELLA